MSVKKNDILDVFNLIYKDLYLSAITSVKYDDNEYDNILRNVR